VREALQGLGSYEMEVGRHSGEYVWELDDGSDRWWVWVSGRHVVKIGAPQGHEIPEDVADEYLDLYPSDLDERGRAREGSASAGRSLEEREEEGELDVPFHLRTGEGQREGGGEEEEEEEEDE
jgi:hypothetical protein